MRGPCARGNAVDNLQAPLEVDGFVTVEEDFTEVPALLELDSFLTLEEAGGFIEVGVNDEFAVVECNVMLSMWLALSNSYSSTTKMAAHKDGCRDR